MVSDYPIIDGIDFGIKPLSHVHANWAGVAYHLTNQDRALDPDIITG